MSQELKVKDQVVLLSSDFPVMVISEINQELQLARCHWYDGKLRKMMAEDLPLNILKLQEDTQVDADTLRRVLHR
jgi:uncharacterized protein YodC (DUF2158 family)